MEGRDEEEKDESIDKYCRGAFTDYKYNIIYEVGKNYTFTEDEPLIDNDYNAVIRILNNFLNENNIVCTL